MNIFTLIGYKPYMKKDGNEIVGFSCFFAKAQAENEENEFGTIIKSVYIPAKAFENCDIEIGASYHLFVAFDSGRKCDVFAGLLKV